MADHLARRRIFSVLVPAVSIAASYLPARRTACVDPARVLRGER